VAVAAQHDPNRRRNSVIEWNSVLAFSIALPSVLSLSLLGCGAPQGGSGEDPVLGAEDRSDDLRDKGRGNTTTETSNSTGTGTGGATGTSTNGGGTDAGDTDAGEGDFGTNATGTSTSTGSADAGVTGTSTGSRSEGAVTSSTGAGSNSTTGGTGGGGGVSYDTEFDTAESPISEGGIWRHFGQLWTFVEVSGGVAYGTQDGSGATLADAVDDSYAYLSGFPPDQRASAVIHKTAGIQAPGLQEVELLLRWEDSANAARGYECLLAWNGAYVEIVRWNGALNDYTYLVQKSPGSVNDGDVFAAEIVGSTITVRLNDRVIASANDSTYTTGNPGIGFFRWDHGGVTNSQSYGFKSFHAAAVGP